MTNDLNTDISRLSLRPFINEDLDLLSGWLDDPQVKCFFGHPDEWIGEVVANLDKVEWIYYYIFLYGYEPIGFGQFYETDKAPEGIWSAEPPRTVGIDYLIGDPAYRSRGLGNEVVKRLLDKIKGFSRYDFAIADPLPGNAASIKILVNNGFTLQNNGLYRLRL